MFPRPPNITSVIVLDLGQVEHRLNSESAQVAEFFLPVILRVAFHDAFRYLPKFFNGGDERGLDRITFFRGHRPPPFPHVSATRTHIMVIY
jgi:hypothetical protein